MEVDYLNSDSDSWPLGGGVSERGGGGGSHYEMGDDDDDVPHDGAGAAGGGGDEDMYYVPPERPLLDLGNDRAGPAGDGVQRWFAQAECAVGSYTSMMSEEAMNTERSMDDQDESLFTRVCLESNDSFSSCYSFDSDCEKTTRKTRSKGDGASGRPNKPQFPKDFDEPAHPSVTVDFTFKAISKTLQKMSAVQLRDFKGALWKNYPQSFATSPKNMDLVNLVDRLLESFHLQGSLPLVKSLLKKMGLGRLVDYLQDLCVQNEVRFELKSVLKTKYGNYEDFGTQGGKKPFYDVFTDLHVTTEAENGPNIEHEFWNIGKLNSHHRPEQPISCKDIFSSSMIEEKCVKALLTHGMAGTGKSMAVQKFILDWAEERSHHHISFVFPLPFRELNAFQGSEISMLDLLYHFYPDTKKLKDICPVDGHALFVLDGLDEYHQTLDFQNTEMCCDIREATSFHVLLVNLLRGNLFYSGLLWVTSRPLRAYCMPSEVLHQVTEVRGFTDAQKVEYFRKRFTKPGQADRVIEHLNACKTLRIMCHLPLFCSVWSRVLECAFTERGGPWALPQSITPIYTRLLLALLAKRSFRAPARSPDQERDFLVNLGKTAWLMLSEKGDVKIPKAHWLAGGQGAVDEAVVNSGLCTEFTVKQHVMYDEKVHCFLHSTVQEYMAALYVFLVGKKQGKEPGSVLKTTSKLKLSQEFKRNREQLKVYVSVLERTLLCEDGRFNVFLRFLFGMALNSNVELLKPFISSSANWPSVVQDTATLIRKKMSENLHHHPNTILQYCLDELTAEISAAASN